MHSYVLEDTFANVAAVNLFTTKLAMYRLALQSVVKLNSILTYVRLLQELLNLEHGNDVSVSLRHLRTSFVM